MTHFKAFALIHFKRSVASLLQLPGSNEKYELKNFKTMIWPLVKKLEKKLLRDDFSDKTGYLYLVSFLLMVTFLLKFPNIHSGDQSFGLVLNLLICGWGVGRTLEINSRTGNEDFLKRFLSLSLITGIKLCGGLLVFTFILKGVKYFAEIISPGLIEGPLLSGLPKLFIGAAASVIFFRMLIHSFKKVNAEEELNIE